MRRSVPRTALHTCLLSSRKPVLSAQSEHEANDFARAVRLVPAPSDVSIAPLGDDAELLLAAARILPWCQPGPRREAAPRLEHARIGDAGGDHRGDQRANAGNPIEQLARLTPCVGFGDFFLRGVDQSSPSRCTAQRALDCCLRECRLDRTAITRPSDGLAAELRQKSHGRVRQAER